MAEAFLRSCDPRLDVCSAGTYPAQSVHRLAITVMREAGIDISQAAPKDVRLFLNDDFDYVITVCDNARESCPIFSGSSGMRLHIGFDDPAEAFGTEEERLAVFRRVRDEIRARFTLLYKQQLAGE
jgi:arsenate reductase